MNLKFPKVCSRCRGTVYLHIDRPIWAAGQVLVSYLNADGTLHMIPAQNLQSVAVTTCQKVG